MPHLSELRAADTLSVDPQAVSAERFALKSEVDGEFTLRDEAAGLVSHVLKATHMAGQNHGAKLATNPMAAMFGLSGEGDEQDLAQINERLSMIGIHVWSLDELTPWTLAFLIVDIVTQVFADLTDELPQL